MTKSTTTSPSQKIADNIRDALSTNSACSSATVSDLQRLLFPDSRVSEEKESIPQSRTKAAGGLKSTKAKQASTGRTAKTNGSVGDTEKRPDLLQRERFALATEVINSTLKILTNELKLQSRSHSRKPTIQNGSREKSHRRSASTPQNPIDGSMQPHVHKCNQSRPAGQKKKSLTKPSLRRSSSFSTGPQNGPTPHIVAIAECARLGFSFLRTPEARKSSGKDLPLLQVEQGMLALVGKLLGHGLETMALKELQVLKRLLESHVCGPPLTNKSETSLQRTTVTSLLVFEGIDFESHDIPLVISFQLQMLRAIFSLKNPRTIEAILPRVELANGQSPAAIILQHADRTGQHEKAARQLEALAQSLLSLCPSISVKDDEQSQDRASKPSPEVAFQLQRLAFQVRLHWWTLAGHKGLVNTEILEPFLRCMTAFTRRSSLPKPQQYELCKTQYEMIQESCSNLSPSPKKSPPAQGPVNAKIHQTLSALAQIAGAFDQALKWTRHQASGSASSRTSNAVRTVTIASIALERAMQDGGDDDIHSQLSDATDNLNASLTGDTDDQEALLTAVSALRRAATKVFLGKGSPVRPTANLKKNAFVAISSCVRFLSRFIGPRPENINTKVAARYQERVSIVLKATKSFLDSAIMASKLLANENSVGWDDLKACLQSCQSLMQNLQDRATDHPACANLHEDMQFPAIKISNVYWAWSLKMKHESQSAAGHLPQAMRDSVDALLLRTPFEQQTGNLASKLDKLSDHLRSQKQYSDAHKFTDCAIRCRVLTGVLDSAITLAETRPLQSVWIEEQLTHLKRNLESLNRLGLLAGKSNFFDDRSLDAITRATLLEFQLCLLCHNLSQNVKPEGHGKNSINEVSTILLSLYSPDEYPLRRLRVSLLLMQTLADHPDVLKPSIKAIVCDVKPENLGVLHHDTGLANYFQHQITSHKARRNLQQPSPTIVSLQQCLDEWQSMLQNVHDWSSIADRIDDFDNWISLLRIMADYFEVKGFDNLCAQALHLITSSLELNAQSYASLLVASLSQLGLQYVRLGYSVLAEASFVKAQHLLANSDIQTEGKLQWHLAYAEYLLSVGNCNKTSTTLRDAEQLLSDGDILQELKKPSTSFQTRVNLNRLLAKANYTYSLFALETGSAKDALQYAKRCVLINRRLWVSLENRDKVEPRARASDGTDAETSSLTSDMSKMSLSTGGPFTMSMTHDSLSGPRFWSLVPTIFLGLSQAAKVCEHQGMAQESSYYLEQAFRIADAVKTMPWVLSNLSTRATLWTKAGDMNKAQRLLEQAKPLLEFSSKSRHALVYHNATALLCEAIGDFDDELRSLHASEALLEALSASVPRTLSSFGSTEVENVISIISQMTLKDSSTKTVRNAKANSKASKARKPAIHPTPKTVQKTAVAEATKQSVEATDQAVDCGHLSASRSEVLMQKAISFLSQSKLDMSAELLHQAVICRTGMRDTISQQITKIKHLRMQYLKAVEDDLTFNGLPESTVSFPAIRRIDAAKTTTKVNAISKTTAASNKSMKTKAKGKSTAEHDFISVLKQAHHSLTASQALALRCGSSAVINQFCRLASSITVLLSVVSAHVSDLALHPLQAAYFFGYSQIHALHLEESATEVEVASASKQALLKWPTVNQPTPNSTLSAMEFQHQYVDIIPSEWSVISMSLSEDRDELYLTRYRSKETPFILRLPMSRHQSRDLDEETFSFESGKTELLEIIELSDFSTHDGQNMASKGAKSEWWEEREALDDRLRDLLMNIENIWLGGFRGIFSQHVRHTDLLSQFQKSFEKILNAHLPSRQSRTKQNQINLDTRILDLFIGLGDPTDGSTDLEEPLMDLVYFVVDILQFNGERIAYDEVDFDAIIVETLDALRSYHSKVELGTSEHAHTILLLDKELHCFPWESLPALQQLSISRLQSLAALRQRILSRSVCTKISEDGHPNGHYLSARGATILNPSRDLSHTEKTLSPYLRSLNGEWDHVVGQEPVEAEFESALSERDLLLYFGHGGGAQYIRQKSVRKLITQRHNDAPSSDTDGDNEAGGDLEVSSNGPTCATTWLMGCSSAQITENGVYEPSGTIVSYMTAGAPAVLGMLWDVTDRDCDRFAVRCGDLWGLWEEQAESTTATKKKGRAAKRSDDAGNKRVVKGKNKEGQKQQNSLSEAVAGSRSACYLRYLNGAAPVVYGIPVYLDW